MPPPDSQPSELSESSPAAHEPVPALCPQCGEEIPVMEALVYHGVVYHPACVYREFNREQGARPELAGPAAGCTRTNGGTLANTAMGYHDAALTSRGGLRVPQHLRP